MGLKTRSSAALEKAQLRLALLKAVDENLDLGYGLTIGEYTRTIESTRAKLEAHNKLVSDLDESRRALTEMDKALSAISERMLSGVATKYGRSSTQYVKAGGSNRKRSSASKTTPDFIAPIDESANAASTSESKNGKSKQPILN